MAVVHDALDARTILTGTLLVARRLATKGSSWDNRRPGIDRLHPLRKAKDGWSRAGTCCRSYTVRSTDCSTKSPCICGPAEPGSSNLTRALQLEPRQSGNLSKQVQPGLSVSQVALAFSSVTELQYPLA